MNVCVADFEAKYVQLDKLGEGGFGSVYAGYSRADNHPVSITSVFSDQTYTHTVIPPCAKQSAVDSVL